MNAYSNILDTLSLQKKIQELCAAFSTQDYLTATSKYSLIVNKQLHNSEQMVQQYKNLIPKFKQQKHIFYYKIHQQGHSIGHAFRKFRRQYKTRDESLLFEPHYPPNNMNQLTQSSPEVDSIILYSPTYDSQINYSFQQRRDQEKSIFQRILNRVHGPKTALSHQWLYQPFEEGEFPQNVEEHITVTSHSCHHFSSVHLTHLCVNDMLTHINRNIVSFIWHVPESWKESCIRRIPQLHILFHHSTIQHLTNSKSPFPINNNCN